MSARSKDCKGIGSPFAGWMAICKHPTKCERYEQCLKDSGKA